MKETKQILEQTVKNLPEDWLRLTTHRLDTYNEKLAKVEFLDSFEGLNVKNRETLSKLPTAFDYIRLGHPLSCVLEWALAQKSNLNPGSVVSFSSQIMPILAVLRKNKFLKKKTRILTSGALPNNFDVETLQNVYGYDFQVVEEKDFAKAPAFDGSTIAIDGEASSAVDFIVKLYPGLGSIIEVMDNNEEYIKEIQHVRRRESIAMTPQSCLIVIKDFIGEPNKKTGGLSKTAVEKTIQEITQTTAPVSFGSCGLSVQYAIMMGLIHYAKEQHQGKAIQFIVPPNCYGGTNDQARRVAAAIENVEIVDLPVDSGKDMVAELERILSQSAFENAVPYIIAEIPTNPRVEIPDLEKLRTSLKKQRKTKEGELAAESVFILDQTFCPNVKFFGEGGYLNDVSAVSYVSGSKFPSGGLCTAGYCVVNEKAADYQGFIEKHLKVCDNGATDFQIEVLTQEIPSMNQRIAGAYENTRAFVDFIQETLPEAKINFVSRDLATASFTPSVFSLDLPSREGSSEEKENYKRELNHKLIRMMIEGAPEESKHCVSYGQLKGCYWTVPATSTQGTTKESDKDYIVRVSVSADFNLNKHQEIFKNFCESLKVS